MGQQETVQTVLHQTPAEDVCRITAQLPCRLRLMLPAKKPLTILHIITGRASCLIGKQYRIVAAGETLLLAQNEQRAFFTQTGGLQGILICTDPEAFPALRFALGKEPCRQYAASPALTQAFAAVSEKGKAAQLPALLAEQTPDPESAGKCCPRAQMRLAAAAYEHASRNPEHHIPIEVLAEQLRVSPTHLKNGFRIVYGDSLYSYLRTQKMLAAAELLHQSSRTVLDIAGDFGYDNGSKFAKAFQSVMGMSPREFRADLSAPCESLSHVRRHPALPDTELL